MASSANKKWLEAAIALQSLQQTYEKDGDLASLPISQFCLVGQQSAGKTRMLSVFAGRKLGGAEKDATGTRCPVIYTFQVGVESARFGDKAYAMKEINVDEIHERITRHMEALGAQENFTADPLYVSISGKSCLNSVVVDLPGLKPAASEQHRRANVIIAELIRQYASPTNTIPIIMTGFSDKMDLEYVEAEFEALLKCCDNKDRTSIAKRAVVFASRLDFVKQNLDSSKLDEFITVAASKGFSSERIVFFSLAPELLDGNTSKDDMYVNRDTAEMNHYFAELIWEKERQNLPSIKTMLRITDGNHQYRLGIVEAKSLIEDTLVTTLKNNFRVAHAKMQREFDRLKEEDLNRSKMSSDDQLEDAIATYTNLFCGVLGGTATGDASRIEKSLLRAREFYPRQVDVSTLDAFAKALLRKFNKTFEEEFDQIVMSGKVDGNEMKFIFEEKTLEKLNEKPEGSDDVKDLAKSWTRKYSGGMAVSRVVSLFGFGVIARPFNGEFTAEEIINMGSYGEPGGCRGFSLSTTMRKMVSRIKTSATCYTSLINWCAWLYASQAEIVCRDLSKVVSLLSLYPQLHERLDGILIGEYNRFFFSSAKKIAKQAEDIVRLRGDTLKIDEPVVTLMLLGCAKLPADLFQDNDAAENARELAQLKQSRSCVNPAAQPNKQDVKCLIEQLECVPDATAHDFVALEGLKLINLNRDQVEENLAVLNKTAQMFANYGSGMTYMAVISLIESGIIEAASQETAVMAYLTKAVHRFLKSPEYVRLKSVDSKRLEHKLEEAGKIKMFIKAAEQLNKCCADVKLPPIRVEKMRQVLQHLELDIMKTRTEIEEAQRQTASLPRWSEEESFLVPDVDVSDDSGDDGDGGTAMELKRLRAELAKVKKERDDLLRKLSSVK